MTSHTTDENSGDVGDPENFIYNTSMTATIGVDNQQRIVLANSFAEHLFGVSPEQMKGSALSRFLVDWSGPEQAPSSTVKLAQVLEGDAKVGRRVSDFTVTGLHVSGRRISLAGSISHRLSEGHHLEIIQLRDVSARQRAHAQLARSHDELRQLSAALQTIREEERTYIARELHDDMGQLLATLQMDLELLQQRGGKSVRNLELIQGMKSTLVTAIASLRRIAANLRPRALDEGSLYFALDGLRMEFSRRHGISCELYADENELKLDDSASTAIYRIVQEALTNIARHAHALNVTLNLYRLDGDLLITIRDDGRGIAPNEIDKTGSLGLVGMRERVWGLRGEIIISREQPLGTTIDIVLPILNHQKQGG